MNDVVTKYIQRITEMTGNASSYYMPEKDIPTAEITMKKLSQQRKWSWLQPQKQPYNNKYNINQISYTNIYRFR